MNPASSPSKSPKRRHKKKKKTKYSVKSLKDAYKREQKKYANIQDEIDIHTQSGIVKHFNVDKDLQRAKYYTANKRSTNKQDKTVNDRIKYTQKKSEVKKRTGADFDDIFEEANERVDILKDVEDWVDIFEDGQTNASTLPNLFPDKVKEEEQQQQPPKTSRKRKGRTPSASRVSTRDNKKKRQNTRKGKRNTIAPYEPSSRSLSTAFNTELSEWMKDIVALNRLEAKQKKMEMVCDYLGTAGAYRGETLRKKKGHFVPLLNGIKEDSKAIDDILDEVKTLNFPKMDMLIDLLRKQRKTNENLQKKAEEFLIYAKSIENTHNLQDSFILNLKSHSVELNKRSGEATMRFLTHVPSHKYTEDDHTNRVLATGPFQLKEWTAGRYGRPPVNVTTKKKAHVTKFGQLLNMDISGSCIPCFPDA